MDNLILFLDSFFEVYGEGFVMLILSGILVALFLELFIKKAFDSLVKAAKEEEKLIKAKTWTCAILAFLLSFLCTVIVFKSSILPGGALYFPEWFFLVYLTQYLMSLYGIKRIKEAWEKKGTKEKPVKVKKRTVSVDAATPVFTKDADGNFIEV